MKTLKILAAPLALAAASLTIAMPAQAREQHQDHRQDQHQSNRQDAWQLTPARSTQIRSDIGSLRTAIDRAAARRTISPREATGLRNDARNIQQLYASYARGGLSRGEVQQLQSRVNNVRVALRMERRDWDNRRG